MRRRSLFAAAALLGSRTARGQSAGPPVVGFLRSSGAADSRSLVDAFRGGLAEHGVVEGRDVVIDIRYADNRLERLPALVNELVASRVAMIVGNALVAMAAKAATATIPIVFVVGADPVRLGLVTSLARPTANLTGVGIIDSELAEKRFAILHELTPHAATIAVLADPSAPGSDVELKSVEETGRALGRRIVVATTSDDAGIDEAVASAARTGAQALFVGVGPLFNSRRERVAALALRHRLPSISSFRNYAEAGGLMTYGASLIDAHRRAAGHVVRILRGAKPGDLPVDLPTRYELVINLRTAKALGLEIPRLLLSAADEVIE